LSCVVDVKGGGGGDGGVTFNRTDSGMSAMSVGKYDDNARLRVAWSKPPTRARTSSGEP
jgi:hypothetical protein